MAFGAVAVVTSASLHARSIQLQISKALPSRFKKIPRFYITSSLFLVLGGALGGMLSQGPKGDLKYRVLVAHYSTNIFGWIGITVAGTLITLIPTMLRTQLPDNAEHRGYKSLPWLVVSVLSIDLGALLNIRAIAVLGILGYLSAWIFLLSPHFRFVFHKRTPFSFTATALSIMWLGIALINLAIDVVESKTWKLVSVRADSLVYMLGIGFALQIGLGALSYLIPVVLGGGSSNGRRNIYFSNRLKYTRLVAHNAGLVLLVTNFSRPAFIFGCVLITLSLLLNLFLLGSLRPAKHDQALPTTQSN